MTIASLARLTAASLAVACVAACSASTGAPDPSSATAEPMIGGDVDNGDPAVGLVYLVDHSAFPQHGLCSGVLVSPDVVLTAAHCLDNSDSTVLGFYTGTGVVSDGIDVSQLTFHQIDAQQPHPGYDANVECGGETPDFGLLHLKTSVTGIAPLHYGARAPVVGDTCPVVGFGVTGDPASAFRTAGQKRTGTEKILSVGAFEVSVAAGTAWADQGDSGGPLLCGGSIVAITRCGVYAQDGTHNQEYLVRTDAVASWIKSWIDAWPHYSCYTVTTCLLHGKEVVPGPDDNPDTWCTDVGGTKRTKQKCGYQ